MASASNFALVVVLPNARRANVKVSPNTTILQVLEDVCVKHKLNPLEWDLSHHNKTVELGNSLRFSAIPNNGTLEMIEAKKPRLESTINLGLQLESGKRLMHQFLPHQTLWDVLDYWAQQGENVYPEKGNAELLEPVCVYMRQEVVGQDQLEIKTLRSLGLTQGSAMIRLIHRSAAQLRHQANVSAPLSRVSIPNPDTINDPPRTQQDTSGRAFEFRQQQRQISTQPPAEPMDISPPPEQERKDVIVSSSVAESIADSSSHGQASNIHEEVMPPVIGNSQRYSKEGALNIFGPRDALLYHGDDVVVNSSGHALLDDSFFDLTVNEVRRQYSELKDKVRQLVEAPLLIQSTREATKDAEKDAFMLRNLHDHPNTIVRIRFTNRYVLQGVFRTAETIESIATWIKEFMIDKTLNFHLFTTPPKEILDNNTRLVEEGLVGMAVIYFGTNDPSAPADQRVLKPEYYEKLSAPDAAYNFIHQKLGKDKLEANNKIDEETVSSSEDQQIPSSSSDTPQIPVQPRPAVKQLRYNNSVPGAPKWFKLN